MSDFEILTLVLAVIELVTVLLIALINAKKVVALPTKVSDYFLP